MTSFLRVVSAALGVALVACGAPDEKEASLATRDAVVTGDTFGRASAIVRGIDYLPFEYKADGCYARALYMGMELAAAGIESNAIFVFAKDEAHELRIPGTSQTWTYHVAPMLQVDRESEWKVLDPSMSSAPLDWLAWIGKMGFRPVDRAFPYVVTTPGSVYASDELIAQQKEQRREFVDTFDEMPPFEVDDVAAACAVMHAYLDVDGRPSNAERARREKLLDRTSELVSRLASRRKLNGPPRDVWTRCEACVMEEGTKGLELGSGCTAR